MKKILIMLAIFLMFAQPMLAENADYISRAAAEGIIVGDENGNFDGNAAATRAEFAAIAVRFLGLSGGVNVFTDVSDSDWFAESISAAAANGMLFGYEDGRVRPYAPIKCEDAVTIIGRYYEAASDGGPRNVSGYARKYYAYALKNSIFTSWSFNNPQHNITKGEILELLYNYKEQDLRRIGFTEGMPKLSEKKAFNCITIEIQTNMPCTVYYGLAVAGQPSADTDKILCAVPSGGAAVTASITANLNERYDIYLRAVSAGAVGRTAVIKSVSPFAFSSGNGTEENPYVIYSRHQLEQAAEYPDKCFVLGMDIVLSGDWQTIDEFSGVLDGNGYKISGLTVNSNDENVGLFGMLSGGTVKNLTIDADIAAKKNVGVIAGVNDGGVIENCVSTGKINAKTGNVGGICGINRGTIANCLSAVKSVTAGAYAGGISGQNYAAIENCLSACETVTSDMYAGGISGTNNGGIVEKCVAVNMTVYNSMTKNGGRITLNREEGITRDNYAYDRTDTNAAAEIETRFSQNGIDTPWESFTDISFYRKIGWKTNTWAAADNGFRLVYPKKCRQPELAAGESMYFPKIIENADGLYEIGRNSGGHYILDKDIYLKLPWKTICGLVGFSGSLDGGGHAIYNLDIRGESGFLSNISGGIVRNLDFRAVKANLGESGGIIAACNYGFIENCTVSGQLTAKRAGSAGVIAGQNNGQIIGCTADCDIIQSGDNTVTGGICSDNSGIITGCKFTGRITVVGKNSVIGGICGYDAGGYIIESFAGTDIRAEKTDAYIGGICGISSATQFYKCSFNGTISSYGGYAYVGGICGMAENSAVYNCFSAGAAEGSAEKAYVGGICGYISGANVQNTYSCAKIGAVGANSYAGGICGYAENGFVMQNVSLCTRIDGARAGAITAAAEQTEISDNYACDKIKINSLKVTESTNNGKLRSLLMLKDFHFYCKPLEEGGLLGWNGEAESGTWTAAHKKTYAFPTFTQAPGQDTFVTPTYDD